MQLRFPLISTLSACALLFCLAATARASEQLVTVSNDVFNGNSVCGSGTSLCTETINVSFDWNTTTGTFSNMTVSALGDIFPPGPFTFFSDTFNNGGFFAFEHFVFFAPNGFDFITMDFGVSPPFSNSGPFVLFPEFGQFSALQCNTLGTFEKFCAGVPGGILAPNNASSVVTITDISGGATPEPSSLLLLGTGLLGLGPFLLRRFVGS